MRKTPLVLAAALTVVTAGCYRDFDFGTDNKADHAVTDFDGTWINLADGTVLHTGNPSDIPVPQDWDGNDFWDRGALTPDGEWVTGAIGTLVVPPPDDLPAYDSHPNLTVLPVPADYDGDGAADPAWYRESDGRWFIDGDTVGIAFGSGPTALPGTGTAVTENDYDFPVPADYDGDGIDDLSVFNPATRTWRVRQSTGGETSLVMGGTGQPVPMPGDYDGLGHAQRAVYTPQGWFVEGHVDPFDFGAAPEGQLNVNGVPAAADYDGDNKVDLSYVSYDGLWFTNGSDVTPYLDFGSGQWPLATGSNLRMAMDRFFLVAYCQNDPSACVTGGG